MTEFFRDLVDEIKDKDTTIMADGKVSAEFSGWIDTGSYILNAQISGSLYGGIPNNKITALAGSESVGKTYFALDIMKYHMADDKAGTVYYDTEQATTNKMMFNRGIDTSRVVVTEPETVEDTKFKILKLSDTYAAKKNPPPLLIVLDSLGNLSTIKERTDAGLEKTTIDMTRAKQIRSCFRVLSPKLSKARIPMLVTNHTYDKIGSMFPEKVMSGGGGLKFVASTIIFLSKAKDKEGTVVVGNIITSTLVKSRFTKEQTKVKVRLSYDTGLDRYYGLVDLAVKHGIFKKISTRIELPDGRKVYEKSINNNPGDYYTDEIMAQLEVAAAKEFSFGNALVDDLDEEVEEMLDAATEKVEELKD